MSKGLFGVRHRPPVVMFIKNQLGLVRVMVCGLADVSYLTIGDVLSESAHE